MAIQRYKRAGLLASFGYACRGIGFAIRSERNMRIHIGASAIAIILGILCDLSTIEWLILCLTLCLVLTAECINTAIEVTVDLSTRKTRYRAMLSKDLAAGAVLITAANAALVGSILFVPKILHALKGLG